MSKIANLQILTSKCKFVKDAYGHMPFLQILYKYKHKPGNFGTIYGHQLLRKQTRDHGKAQPFYGPLAFQISEGKKERKSMSAIIKIVCTFTILIRQKHTNTCMRAHTKNPLKYIIKNVYQNQRILQIGIYSWKKISTSYSMKTMPNEEGNSIIRIFSTHK